MIDPPFPREALAEQMTLCQDLLTHFKEDQERLLSHLDDWWAAKRQGVTHPPNGREITQAVADLRYGRVGYSYSDIRSQPTGPFGLTLSKKHQKDLERELRKLGEMLEEDKRFGRDSAADALHYPSSQQL